ncbi:unnamed protein product [Ilex paraguariensis]|uniref:Uncharacterized protein n=1 Tax=Ilex paraguariensis TaxID=185542 RepID=A0ABC8RX74_9AQUA
MEQLMVSEGKNPVTELAEDEKETKDKSNGKNFLEASAEQIKGKEIMQNSNSGKTNKETTYQGKSQSQLKHSKLAQQWRGKKQQQPKQVNNPIKETTVTFGKEIFSVITEGDMEKQKSFTRLEKGDHSGKDKIVQHGKYIPAKKSVQLIDSENPMACDTLSNHNNVANPFDQNNDASPPYHNNETNPQAKDLENPPLSKSASILEKEDHEQNLMNTNQHSEIQEP